MTVTIISQTQVMTYTFIKTVIKFPLFFISFSSSCNKLGLFADAAPLHLLENLCWRENAGILGEMHLMVIVNFQDRHFKRKKEQ